MKASYFISNLNCLSSEDSFEVLHVSLAQKLTNLEFLTKIFSNVAIGHFARSLRPLVWPQPPQELTDGKEKKI